jgi:hypothetical protein
VGQLIRELEGDGRSLAEASVEDLAAVDDRFEGDDLTVLELRPSPIDDQLAAIRSMLGD